MVTKYLRKDGRINFEALDKTGFPIVVIISERGYRGKTFGLKEYMLKQHKEKGYVSRWVMNTQSQLDRSWPEFLTNHILHNPANWDGVIKGKETLELNGKVFLKSVPLTGASREKGSRSSLIRHIGYDEFNEETRYVKGKQNSKLLGLLATYKNFIDPLTQPKLWILGNYTTLFSEIFMKWGIFSIDSEVTEIYDEKTKGKRMLIIVPDSDTNEVEKRAEDEDDTLYWLAKRSGESEHIYMNKSVLDDVNGIIKLEEDVVRCMTFIARYYINGEFFDMFINRKNNYYFCRAKEWLNVPDAQILTLRKEDIKHTYAHRPDAKITFISAFSKGIIYFGDIASKGNFTLCFK